MTGVRLLTEIKKQKRLLQALRESYDLIKPQLIKSSNTGGVRSLSDQSQSSICASRLSSFHQVIKYGEPLDELQRDELRTAVEKLRRQMLRKSREYDCQILQERMELLHQAHQVCCCL